MSDEFSESVRAGLGFFRSGERTAERRGDEGGEEVGSATGNERDRRFATMKRVLEQRLFFWAKWLRMVQVAFTY